MRSSSLVPLALLACGCGAPAPSRTSRAAKPTHVGSRPASTASTAKAAASDFRPSFDDCRAAIAKRFHPSASWSQPWTHGPTALGHDCHPWFDGSPPLATPVDPLDCNDIFAIGGWAGIGAMVWSYGWGLSDDGLTMARCNGTCTVLRVADGRVLARSGPPASMNADLVDLPQNKALLAKYGLDQGKTELPVSDAFIDFSFAPEGAAVTYHLRDRASDVHVAIGRFARANEYVFPEPWMISKNGRTLLLRVRLRPKTQGVSFDDAVVDFPPALALLYVEAATKNPSNVALQSRAEKACAALR